MPPMLAICRKLAIMAVSSFVLLVLAELAARLSEPGAFRWFDVSPYEKVENLPHVHRPRSQVQWDGTFYGIDTHGWRGPEFAPTFAEDELRIVAIGDSTTFGKGVEEIECWPRQLERVLQEKLGPSRKVMVANLGVNGYASRDYLEVLRTQALELKPHAVIVGFCLNDFPNVLAKVDKAVYQNQQNLRSKLSWDMRAQLGKLALFRWARATYYEVNRDRDLQQVEAIARSVAQAQGENIDALGGERERLTEIVRLCQEANAGLVTFLFPYESQVYLETPVEGPSQALGELSRSLGVKYLDISAEFRATAQATEPPTKLFIRGDRYHPNGRGYAIVARRVSEVLVDLGLGK
jgi:lysophospholipase L1-like esterase